MNADTQYKKMTETPIPKLILGLSLPTIASMLITNLYNMADTYFVGTMGTSASGATGVVFGLMAILQAFGFMYGHGAGSNISRRLGARDVESAQVFCSTSFFLALFTGIGILIIGMVFLTPLMYLFGSTDTILPYAKTYATFILLAGPAMTTGCVMNNILRYEGKATFAMVGLCSGGILNIFGDYLLIEKFHMGIAGAGLSTLVSQYISIGILLLPYLKHQVQSRISWKFFTTKAEVVWNICKTGFPSMLRQGLGSVSTMVLNTQARVYGDAAIAALSIVSRVLNFLGCVSIGIGQGFQPVAAFNFGAKKYSRVKQGFVFAMVFSMVFLGCIGAFGVLKSEWIVSLFRDDMEVIAIGSLALRAQSIILVILPISIAGSMLFQSVGMSLIASALASLRSGAVLIPTIYILAHYCGLTGIQLSQAVAETITVVLTIPLLE